MFLLSLLLLQIVIGLYYAPIHSMKVCKWFGTIIPPISYHMPNAFPTICAFVFVIYLSLLSYVFANVVCVIDPTTLWFLRSSTRAFCILQHRKLFIISLFAAALVQICSLMEKNKPMEEKYSDMCHLWCIVMAFPLIIMLW